MAKSRTKGAKAAFNEFYESLPEDWRDYVTGGDGAYSEMENYFRDAFNKFNPKGIKEKISEDYDLGDTPEKAADIFFFQDPAYGEPDNETDTGNILYKAHPEMRENFLRLIAGTPEEREAAAFKFGTAYDTDDVKLSDMAHALYSKFPGLYGSFSKSFADKPEEEVKKAFSEQYPKMLKDYLEFMGGETGETGEWVEGQQDVANKGLPYDDAVESAAAMIYGGPFERDEAPKEWAKELDKLTDAEGKNRKFWGTPEWKKKFLHEDKDSEDSGMTDTQSNILNGLRDLS